MSRLGHIAALVALALAACTSAEERDAVRAPEGPAGAVEALPASPDPELGRQIALEACGRCHALQGEGPSPHPAAPAFPMLARRLPGDVLLPRLEEGIRASHPDMPEVRLAPAEIDSFLAYWATL